MCPTRSLKEMNEKMHIKCLAGSPEYKKQSTQVHRYYFYTPGTFLSSLSWPLLLAYEPPPSELHIQVIAHLPLPNV